ncbi:LysR family transcriptional regulator [Leisingera sp. HS039]|uniref:LysR family transcriptional regulator n=1 Tax=unclassified Leisingera TaxID=2614906 RepID=UPI0010708D4B|nr:MULTISPECIES: LysR family transcriptional regulator [unclassified Leisingera]MBQ4823798.1 LysR family transcriptional regulator [Leisingera sp. HS039]QBR35266.1 LysR family transcriptional regulator [Leisingera sp. NJS201]
MKLDPRHLELLFAIVDRGGLTEGAELLGKSQPSLSRSLAMLEERVGAPLFEPGRRPLQPTELGLALAEEGRKVFLAVRGSGAVLEQFQRGKSGAVRVAGTPVFLDGVISPMIAEFQMGYPGVRIDQSYGYPGDLMPKLKEGTLDLAVLPLRQASIPEGFSFDQILPGRNVIACRAGHPLVRRGAVKLPEIAQYSWIAPPADSPLYHDLRAVLEGIGVKDFKVSFSGGSLSAVVSILTGSDALTVLPFSVVFMMRRQKSISALPVRIGDPDRHLGILRYEAQPMRPSVKRFAGYIRSEFKTLSASITRVGQDAVWRP